MASLRILFFSPFSVLLFEGARALNAHNGTCLHVWYCVFPTHCSFVLFSPFFVALRRTERIEDTDFRARSPNTQTTKPEEKQAMWTTARVSATLTSQEHEKFLHVLAALRRTPNVWASLDALDGAVVHGSRLARFPVRWVAELARACKIQPQGQWRIDAPSIEELRRPDSGSDEGGSESDDSGSDDGWAGGRSARAKAKRAAAVEDDDRRLRPNDAARIRLSFAAVDVTGEASLLAALAAAPIAAGADRAGIRSSDVVPTAAAADAVNRLLSSRCVLCVADSERHQQRHGTAGHTAGSAAGSAGGSVGAAWAALAAAAGGVGADAGEAEGVQSLAAWLRAAPVAVRTRHADPARPQVQASEDGLPPALEARVEYTVVVERRLPSSAAAAAVAAAPVAAAAGSSSAAPRSGLGTDKKIFFLTGGSDRGAGSGAVVSALTPGSAPLLLPPSVAIEVSLDFGAGDARNDLAAAITVSHVGGTGPSPGVKTLPPYISDASGTTTTATTTSSSKALRVAFRLCATRAAKGTVTLRLRWRPDGAAHNSALSDVSIKVPLRVVEPFRWAVDGSRPCTLFPKPLASPVPLHAMMAATAPLVAPPPLTVGAAMAAAAASAATADRGPLADVAARAGPALSAAADALRFWSDGAHAAVRMFRSEAARLLEAGGGDAPNDGIDADVFCAGASHATAAHRPHGHRPRDGDAGRAEGASDAATAAAQRRKRGPQRWGNRHMRHFGFDPSVPFVPVSEGKSTVLRPRRRLRVE